MACVLQIFAFSPFSCCSPFCIQLNEQRSSHKRGRKNQQRIFDVLTAVFFSGFLGHKAALFGVWFPKFVPKLWEPHTQTHFSPTNLYVNRNHGSWGGRGHTNCYRGVDVSCNTIEISSGKMK